MPIRAWFPTLIYCELLQESGLDRLNAGLADECRRLREFDAAGRRWSDKNYPGGYTSYASMNELHRFSSSFADLERKLTRDLRRLKGQVVFHLAEVRRINSCGVREWVNFVRDLPGVSELTFSHCSPAIVTQLNMIYNFRGAAKVRSFLAPYVCENCGHEEEKLLDLQTHFPTRDFKRVPDFKCDKCGKEMEFDDLPERYLSFLGET